MPDLPGIDRQATLDAAHLELEEPGQYLVFREIDVVRVVPLAREWTRIGRSLAAGTR